MLVDSQNFFLKASSIWLYSLIALNLASLVMVNVSSGPTHPSYPYAYAAMIVNIGLSYLVIGYYVWKSQHFEPSDQPFYRWIWFGQAEDTWYNVLKVICFIAWIVPNFLMTLHLYGWGIVMAIHFWPSFAYWSSVLGMAVHSYWNHRNAPTVV